MLLLCPLLAVAAGPEPRVELSAPRDYGYVMGDLIEHTLTVAVPEAYGLDTGYLPAPGPLDEWLDVRSVDWNRTRADGETRYRIRVVYQLFKGVRSAEKAAVPALPLRFAGPDILEAKAPEWAFTVTPLIPPALADENVAIREALPPDPLATRPHWRRLLACLAGAAAVAGFLGWQNLGWRRRTRPFGRAQRELKKLLRTPATPQSTREAARVLHRALDETAGETLFAGRIEDFCQGRPAFAALRDELRDFFELSRRLFFTSPEEPVPKDYPPARLADLCRRCAAAERRTP